MVPLDAAGAAEQVVRQRRVAEAIHSVEMDGLPVNDATRADAEDYIVGAITADELVEHVLAR